jgi:UDP-N-acetylmuramoylalanine--D-glutamate ligase
MAGVFDPYDQVFIWGFGREGHAVLDLLQSEGRRSCAVIIDQKQPSHLPGDVRYCAQDTMIAALEAAKNPLLIKSPGISLYDPLVGEARKAGAISTSQTNLYFQTKPQAQTVIGVTGTKGKSTTSALIDHMLKGLGQSVTLAGNIGVPVLQAPNDAKYVVLELSSYQIADLATAPEYFVFLNMLSDHTPWHHGIDQYRSDKMRLAEISPDAIGVMNAKDDRLHVAFDNQPNRNWFNTQEGFHLRGSKIYRGDTKFGEVNAMPGEHNALNVCAALTLIETLGFDPLKAFISLENFKGLPHRLQTVHTIGAVDFIDDSLATTPESCLLAMEALRDRPIALILGGADRQQDYSLLRDGLDSFSNIKSVTTISDNTDTITSALNSGRHSELIQAASSLEDSVRLAFETVGDTGIVLFSPAAPSGKEHRDYTHRAQIFLQAARALA